VINRHPVIGAAILGQVKMLSAIMPGIFQHHKRLDGSGYLYGLHGD
jgi:HD-GYP domain-containing protein (c-di-GMP phosphodiesterase class II)